MYVLRMYVRTDGQTFEIGFIRLTLSKSRPKKRGGNHLAQVYLEHG